MATGRVGRVCGRGEKESRTRACDRCVGMGKVQHAVSEGAKTG